MKFIFCLSYSSVLLSGLLAGSSFAFVLGMAPAMQQLSVTAYLELHRSMTTGFFNSWTTAIYGLLLVNIAAVLWTLRRSWASAEFILMALALLCVLEEIFMVWKGNLPLNRLIYSWQTVTPPETWREVQTQWLRFMYMRSALLLTAFALLLASSYLMRRTPGSAVGESRQDVFAAV